MLEQQEYDRLEKKKYHTVHEYAKWRNVSRAAVHKAINSNRLEGAYTKVNDNYQIFKDLADKLWDSNKTVEQASHSDAVDIDSKYGQVDIKQDAPTSNTSYNKAKAVEKTFQAKLAQITYNEKVGKLVDADVVKQHYYEQARKIRDGLLNIPARIMEKVAVESDPYECERLLTVEINDVLEEIIDAINGTDNSAKGAE